MAILMSCVTSKTLAPCTPEVSRQQRHTCISVSAHRRQIRIGLTMKSWGTSCTVPPMRIRGATRYVRMFSLSKLLFHDASASICHSHLFFCKHVVLRSPCKFILILYLLLT
uniref:Uncharacterized protein n=1 Tax=Aegilops tauschii subsp. strangulata TaxID=200361 RepID=A0A453C3B5_AEGTS